MSRRITVAIGAAFVTALAVVIWRDLRARRRATEIEAERAAVQAAEDARGPRELRGSTFDPPSPEDRAALEARLAEAKRKARLPKCQRAPGDPLCSETPGQTGAP